MAKQLGRWRMTDAPPPVGARPGAFLTSPVDDLARRHAADLRTASPRQPARPARHIHIHLPAPAKVRTHDQGTASAGFPISTGDVFSVSDCTDGGFALRRIRVGDTDKDGMETPPGDAVFGASDPPGAASLDQLRRKAAAKQVNDRSAADGGMGQIAAMQQYLDKFYAPRS